MLEHAPSVDSSNGGLRCLASAAGPCTLASRHWVTRSPVIKPNRLRDESLSFPIHISSPRGSADNPATTPNPKSHREAKAKTILHCRAASECLEPNIADDLRLGVDLDMQPHNIATLSGINVLALARQVGVRKKNTYSRRAHQSFTNRLIRLVEGSDVPGTSIICPGAALAKSESQSDHWTRRLDGGRTIKDFLVVMPPLWLRDSRRNLSAQRGGDWTNRRRQSPGRNGADCSREHISQSQWSVV
jgi:hypothetical protein